MPTKHSIDQLAVWLDKPAVQQAFSNLAAPIIEAMATADTYGEKAAGELYGDDGKSYPKSGEAVIGRAGGLAVKLVIEPDKGGWMGEHLTHDEINAIGISNMVIDGQPLKNRES